MTEQQSISGCSAVRKGSPNHNDCTELSASETEVHLRRPFSYQAHLIFTPMPRPLLHPRAAACGCSSYFQRRTKILPHQKALVVRRCAMLRHHNDDGLCLTVLPVLFAGCPEIRAGLSCSPPTTPPADYISVILQCALNNQLRD